MATIVAERQFDLLEDGQTEWRGRTVTVRERRRNAARAKEWREAHPEQFKAARNAWTAENGERIRAQKREYYQRNKQRILMKNKRGYERRKAAGLVNPHQTRLRQKYGMALEQYQALLAGQDGRCAICRRLAEEVKHAKLVVDHCHQTGAIRGLLCDDCNVGIGRLGDTLERVRAAAEYLTRPGTGLKAS